MTTQDPRLDRMEATMEQINIRLGNLEREVSNLSVSTNYRVDGMWAEMNARFAEGNYRVNTLTTLIFITIGMVVLSAAGIIATILATN